MTTLLAPGGRDGEEALDEAQAVGTVRAEGAFTPQHGGTQCPFGRIVGRLDPFMSEKGPQSIFQFDQVATKGTQLAMQDASSLLQQGVEGGAHLSHVRLEGRAIQLALFGTVPEGKQLRLHCQRPLAPRARHSLGLAEGYQIVLQMRPSDLALRHRQPFVGTKAVGGEDPHIGGAQQVVQFQPFAASRQIEQGALLLDGDLQPTTLSSLLPTGLVYVGLLAGDQSRVQVIRGQRQGLRNLLATAHYAATTDLYTEGVDQQASYLTLAQAVAPVEQRHQADQVRPEGAGR